ncbi:MAG: amidase [Roseiflexaceae bacterium]
MSTASIPSHILAQLEANLQAAGIPATPADLEGILAKGFLSRVATFEHVVADTPADTIPDQLRDSSDGLAESVQLLPALSSVASAGPGEIATLAAALRARQTTAVELAEQALAAIAAHDSQLNAFQLVLADQARVAAAQADRELQHGVDRGPLHGIPVAVKDLLDLAGTPTTAGSKILAGNIAQHDSFAVERLRAAGAVIVGKTRLSEFAYSPGSNNGHYGPTANPRNPAHDTGGSSSGSAAAVAAGIVPVALGSDTGGSIRIPAALCGLVGLKPTFGRVSLRGAVTLAWSLDHLGPLTRTVADAALMLDLLSGYDPGDPRTRRVAAPHAVAQLQGGVAGKRIGVVQHDGSGNPLATDAYLAGWQAGLVALERAGAQLVAIDMPELELLRAVQGCILALDAVTFHEPWLRTRLNDYGEFMRQRILSSYAFGSRSVVQAQQARALLRQRCLALFDHVDLISTPSQPDVAPALGVPASTLFTNPFNTLGWPAVSIPVGDDSNGLPIGLQLVARPWHEAELLQAAYALEQAYR